MSCIVQLNGDRHEAVKLLLPWFVTGRIDAADAVVVEAHLESCATCRADLALEQQLGQQFSNLALDAERSWAAFKPQLKLRAAPRESVGGGQSFWQRFTRPQLFGGAMLAQAACVALLILVVRPPALGQTEYQAMSGASATTGDLVVMFATGVTEQEMRTLLGQSQARIVDGPNSAGAYTIKLDGEANSARLKMLRARPELTLAEPLTPGPAS